jgi:hypothetical protein
MRRGLLRLWLVLSLLWISSLAAWVELRDPWYAAPHKPPQEMTAIENWLSRTYFWYRESPIAAFNRLDVVIALGPPAMLLLIGSGLGWAFLGFRKRA